MANERDEAFPTLSVGCISALEGSGERRAVKAGDVLFREGDRYFLETSMPGVFAAGDVRSDSVKRVASAVGEGSMVVSFVHAHIGAL